MGKKPEITLEARMIERLEEARRKLALRNYDRAGLAVDEVIGCLVDYYSRKKKTKSCKAEAQRKIEAHQARVHLGS
jgi:hypothetical protein